MTNTQSIPSVQRRADGMHARPPVDAGRREEAEPGVLRTDGVEEAATGGREAGRARLELLPGEGGGHRVIPPSHGPQLAMVAARRRAGARPGRTVLTAAPR